MLERSLTDDARAILLLCARFGKEGKENEPLNTREYNVLAQWLLSLELRPGDLLCDTGRAQLRNGLLNLDLTRVERLLERGVAMSLDMEKWMSKGIWVVCRSDAEYPDRLRSHLRLQAPPFLYCTGNPSLLEGGGLAVVGSRDVQADGERFTQRVARRCAEYGVPVVSGGARGVDQAAMLAALEADGRVIGVLADSLSRTAVSAKYRVHLRADRLLLCSPYRPDAGFSAGLAMGRNKLVYSMADYALIIQSDKEKGGTWNGATEELRRPQANPVFVRIEDPIPVGNSALLKLGALPFPWEFFDRPPIGALLDAVHPREVQISAKEEQFASRVAEPVTTQKTVEAVRQYKSERILDAVRPLILAELTDETTIEELAIALDVRRSQAADWVKALVKEKTVKKLTRPVRYVRSEQIELV